MWVRWLSVGEGWVGTVCGCIEYVWLKWVGKVCG